MKVFLGADHGGFELKEKLIQWLQANGYEVEDCGAFEFDKEDDYPHFSFAVAEKVAQDPTHTSVGIIACRSGAGVIIAANKVHGVRAVTVYDQLSAERAKTNNNANVIGIAGDWLNDEQVKKVVETFLQTPFTQESRHVRRLEQIAEYENKESEL